MISAKDRKASERERPLMEATLRIIGREGLDRVTHRAVAAEAGMSVGAVTHHFGTRDGLGHTERLDALQAASAESNGLKLEVSSTDTQTFLGAQLAVLDKNRQAAEPTGMDSSRLIRGRGASLEGEDSVGDEARVNEHIGPVQFNMGGIQVDADDMLQRLKVRNCRLVNLLYVY